MSDTGYSWLINQLQSHRDSANSLWIADENTLDSVPALAAQGASLRVIGNRFDVNQALVTGGVQSQFSDFDFSALSDASLEHIYYRVSKEKPVVHHVLNEACRLLAPGGQLHLAGQKTEGVKTYWDKARP